MRFKTVLSFSTLAAFLATLTIGCSQGTDVKLADAPPVKPAESGPLPKDVKKGGGQGSSGNAGRNPGKDPGLPPSK
jgi:hypothetical protein